MIIFISWKVLKYHKLILKHLSLELKKVNEKPPLNYAFKYHLVIARLSFVFLKDFSCLKFGELVVTTNIN